MQTLEVAEKLVKVLKAIDLNEVIDNEYTVEKAVKDITESPIDVISTLLDYLSE